MGREYPGYRDQLARIDAMYPGRMSLSIREVSELEGGMSEKRLRRRYRFVEGRISVHNYAHRLCEIYEGGKPAILRR